MFESQSSHNFNKIKISKNEINNLIKSSRHPYAGRISADYAPPLPDRQFGEPLKGDGKRWVFDGTDKGNIEAWIERAKNIDEMKGIKRPTLLSIAEEQKKAEKTDRKMQMFQELLNRLGIPAPVGAAPGASPSRPLGQLGSETRIGAPASGILPGASGSGVVMPTTATTPPQSLETQIKNALDSQGIYDFDDNVDEVLNYMTTTSKSIDESINDLVNAQNGSELIMVKPPTQPEYKLIEGSIKPIELDEVKNAFSSQVFFRNTQGNRTKVIRYLTSRSLPFTKDNIDDALELLRKQLK